MPNVSLSSIATTNQTAPSARDPELWRLAKSLESTFLSEMLGAAGLGQTSEEFSGGIGEEQFSSFLNQQRAAAMVEKGGIGLAESIYRSITEQGITHDSR